MQFSTVLTPTGPNTTGIVVPPEIVDALDGGRHPKVFVTLNGFVYRSSIAVMRDLFMIPVSAAIRAEAKVQGSDAITVELALDTEKREVVVPEDLCAALAAKPSAQAKFESLSNSNKSRHVLSVEGAKTPETRARRITKVVSELSL